jgi:hypothetical protein
LPTRGRARPGIGPLGSNRSGNYDIWIINCSFQELSFTQITNNSATDYAADWQSL